MRFTVEQALRGREDQLKEYVIGVEVFDRNTAYDPRIDPIVRVEARRLRSKLRDYYQTEGRDDALRIEFPIGGYIPDFQTAAAGSEAPNRARSSAAGCAIAVLPFTNLSSDAENEYFSDGLTEELIRAVTKMEGLRVVAASTAMQLKGKPHDVRAIGEQLNVRFVLEGSVRKSGGRLRITAQLLDAVEGFYLWSESYDRQMEDVFAIQDEISGAIARTLRLRLVGEKAGAPGRKRNLEAYNLYLQGRFHFNKRTEAGLRKAIATFRESLSIEPEYAAAYAGLADSYALLSRYGIQRPADVMEAARKNAQRALELEPGLADAHVSMGFVKSSYDWDWKAAERHYVRALELNPNHASAHQWYGEDFLTPTGNLDEALLHVRRATELDPLTLVTLSSLAGMFVSRREYASAAVQAQKIIEMDPNFYRGHMVLGRAYVQMGRLSEGIQCFQRGKVLSGNAPYITAVLAHAYAVAGRAGEARELLAELLDLSARRWVPATSLALVAFGLGELELGFDWLEHALGEREGPLVNLNVYPTYDPVRLHPRFKGVIGRLGLTPRD